MSEEDQNLLNSWLPYLVRNIGIEDGVLLAHLRARGALTQHQEETIKSQRDRNRQIRLLIDTLLRGDSNTVDKLISSLRATGQSHVADRWLRQPRQADEWGNIDIERVVPQRPIKQQHTSHRTQGYTPFYPYGKQQVSGIPSTSQQEFIVEEPGDWGLWLDEGDRKLRIIDVMVAPLDSMPQPQASERPEDSCKVRVTGVGLKVDDLPLLKPYFESKRSGGGPIASTDVNKEHETAVITFKSPEDARSVAEKGLHCLGDWELMVYMAHSTHSVPTVSHTKPDITRTNETLIQSKKTEKKPSESGVYQKPQAYAFRQRALPREVKARKSYPESTSFFTSDSDYESVSRPEPHSYSRQMEKHYGEKFGRSVMTGPKTEEEPGESEHKMMTEKHKEALTKHFEDLTSIMTADALLDELVAENIITMDVQEELLGEKSSRTRAGLLLRLLIKREDKTYYVLIQALKKYSMPYLAKLLEDADKE